MHVRASHPLLFTAAATVLALTTVAAVSPGSGGRATPSRDVPAAEVIADLDRPAPTTDPAGGPTADRYAMAGGCYVMQSVATGQYLGREDGAFAATTEVAGNAERLHFQAYDLGKYLLYAAAEDFLAVEAGPVEQTEPARETVEGRAPVTGDTDLPGAVHGDAPDVEHPPAPDLPSTRGTAIVPAVSPTWLAEWVVEEAPAGTFTFRLPVNDGSPAEPGPPEPEIDATLVAGEDGTLTAADGTVDGEAARFRLAPGEGCAEWPEVEVNVSGEQPTGETPYGETRGFLDGHLHMMAFEFLGGRVRCGQPWHPYGVTHALVDCPDHEPGGHGAMLEHILSGTDPVAGHDTTGWPTFGYWPKYDSLTHEQVYYRWLERAWRGGLRMFTNLLVDNSALCEAYPYKRNSCNEMETVRLQAQRLRELERYIDAQAGGPGEGWFQIVTDPFQARRIINDGKLAVVMGIEVSALFDCVERQGVPQCTSDTIDEQLREFHDLGVRQLELVNKFDNALSGVAGDRGATGVVVNQGNLQETGHYWRMDTCDEPDGHDHHAHDKTQPNVHDDVGTPEELTGRDALAGGVLALAGQTGAAPVYPQGPHCNTAGLTALGRHLVLRLIENGLIFDPDHMSALARAQALDVIEAEGYSGVVSSHSWADGPSYRRIWELGGVVTPMSRDAEGFVEKWQRQRDFHDDRFLFGLGYGADTNGFAAQGGPRNPDDGDGVSYPFTGFGGVTIDRQVSGEQIYDINTDGVDHYGLYPDWIEDLRVLAGDDIVDDMTRGPEAYLQMWERALGIPGNACRDDIDVLSRGALDALERGMAPEEVLLALGQPDARPGDTFRFCVEDGTGVAVFEDGRLVRTEILPT